VRQKPANGGAADLHAPGDLGFADAGTIEFAEDSQESGHPTPGWCGQIRSP